MFKFTIRELLLLTLVVGLGVGWFIDHRRQSGQIEEMRLQRDYGELRQRIHAMEYELREVGIRIEYINGENNWIVITKNPDGTETRRFNGFLNDGYREPPPNQ